jgi:multimeric flavodoxin WrbA
MSPAKVKIMRAVVMNGLHKGDTVGEAVYEQVQSSLRAGGWEVEPFVLRDHKIAPCVEDFGCWIWMPGECLIKDAAHTITASFLTSDLTVFITPVTFGGYSSELKKVLDRSIGFALPYLKSLNGETHHPVRYDRTPALFFVGTDAAPDAERQRIFRALVSRNELNMRPPSCGVAFAASESEAPRVAEEVMAAAPKGGAQ